MSFWRSVSSVQPGIVEQIKELMMLGRWNVDNVEEDHRVLS